METNILRAGMIFSKSEAATLIVSGAPADAVDGSVMVESSVKVCGIQELRVTQVRSI